MKTLPIDEILAKCEAANVAYSRASAGRINCRTTRISMPMAACSNRRIGDGRRTAGRHSRRCRWSSAMRASGPGLERQPPRIGEHTDEILGAAGYSERDIADLRSAGVLGAVANEPA